MKILVTGGTGVLGTAAVPALLRAGHTVRLLSRHAEHDARSFPDGVEAFAADVGEPGQLAQAAEGCEVVLHLAGIVEEEPPEVTFEKVNVDGTRYLLASSARAGAPFFIYVSSLGAERGESAYHQSKRRAESLVRAYAGPWLILRPGDVYGPGDETISTLLKMLRGLPAVPVVARGDQPFQPLWFADLGQVFVQAVERRELAGQALELAGRDVTTTEDVLRRLEEITGCERPRLAWPVWLTEVGVQAIEAFGATGRKVLRRAGLDSPLNSSTLTMLLETSVIDDPGHNALVTVFSVEPTPLDEGLRMLADLQPEQTPGAGVGSVKRATFFADIRETPQTAAALLDRVCENIRDVMPIEFSAEPDAPTSAKPGETLTLQIAARGHVQVRLEERTRDRATFVTLEGHPIAGVMQLHTEDLPEGVRFSVNIVSQAANILDWLALHTLGASLQAANWRSVVQGVVALSGGGAPGGVQESHHILDGGEFERLRDYVDRIVQAQQRRMRDAAAMGEMAQRR